MIIALGDYAYSRGAARVENDAMLKHMNGFVEAHDRYLALDRARVDCMTPQQKELMHIELMRAYLEVQYRASQITGLQYADGMHFADMQ